MGNTRKRGPTHEGGHSVYPIPFLVSCIFAKIKRKESFKVGRAETSALQPGQHRRWAADMQSAQVNVGIGSERKANFSVAHMG